MIRFANVSWSNQETNIFLLQCSIRYFTWRHTYVSLSLVTYNLPKSHCCATLSIFKWLTVTCSSTTHRMHCCFHCNNSYATTAQCYAIRSLPILLRYKFQFPWYRSRKTNLHTTHGLTSISQMRIYLPVDNQSHAVRQHLGCNPLGSGWADAPEQLVASMCSLHP
jgi:hypothetical protein